ncbi:MAG: RidA family protein [Pseudomonadota bacterium]
MTIKRYNPDTVYQPVAPYYQNSEVPAGARWLVTAGQVGIDLGGDLIKDHKGQIKQTWANVRAVVEAAGMTPDDIVKLTIYMTPNVAEHLTYSREVRIEALDGAKPAATLVYVAGLADPDMVIEVDVTAAKV